MMALHAKHAYRKGRKDLRGHRQTYTPSRLEDDLDNVKPHDEDANVEPDQDHGGSDVSSEDEAEDLKQNSYSALLQSFGTVVNDEEPCRKKRKLESEETHARTSNDLNATEEPERPLEEDAGELEELGEDAEDHDGAEEDEDASDTFELHFARPDENELAEKLRKISSKEWQSYSYTGDSGSRWTISKPGRVDAKHEQDTERSKTPIFHAKQRLFLAGSKILSELQPLEKAFACEVSTYKDILFGSRTVTNSSSLCSILCLHAVNHIFKTRDRVIKNNAKLAKPISDPMVEYRDQGFTRPKVLILLPTRQSCVRYVNSLVSLCAPEQQENKKRFEDSFVALDDMSSDRPDDYRELFEGNNDDLFRLGVKFTRKTIKFFSAFYNSDLIIASPLGLRQAISGKKPDADFLSSIEILITDQADAMQMQNWDHIIHILANLNIQPKEAHGCDFSRVRSWYLDGNSRYLRQTIFVSTILTMPLKSTFALHAQNIAGKVICRSTYPGAILGPQTSGIKQTFLRFHSPSLLKDPEVRFKHFVTALLPSIAKMPKNPDGTGLGILIYVPDSLDFPKLRNHFSFHASCANISFGAIDENHGPADRDVRRARSYFESGRHSVLLYTERAHHFYRYQIRGVRQVIFFGVPNNPLFYEEVAAYIDNEEGRDGDVRCLFSTWERMALERVVGTRRMGRMVREGRGDVFEFL